MKILSTRTVHSGYLEVVEAQVAGQDGRVFARQIEQHGHAAAVLPYDPARRLALLIRAPRAPVVLAGGPDRLVEAPAGMLEDGERAETCVIREAFEEAGVRLSALEFVARAWTSPGVSTETLALFLAPYALADRQGKGGGLAEENEDVEAFEIPLAELWAEVEAHRIADLKTLTLVQALRLRRPALFAAGGTGG
ncbi:MAG: NUDIX hydrolase [Phenylobacterium sp.]